MFGVSDFVEQGVTRQKRGRKKRTNLLPLAFVKGFTFPHNTHFKFTSSSCHLL